MKKRRQAKESLALNSVDEIFQELNEALRRAGLTLRIICCGGYLMNQLGSTRETKDVDAFYTSNQEIDQIIKRIGDAHGLNTGRTIWLNNAVSTMSDWPDPAHYSTAKAFSNLTIDEVSPEYLLGMKLSSVRPVDVEDSAYLVKLLKLENPVEAYNKIHPLNSKVNILAVLKAFAQLYGEKWQWDYFRANQEEILALLDHEKHE